MRILPGPTKSNQVLAWSPDGRWLVAGGSGDGLTAWDVDGGAPGRRIFTDAHGGKFMRFCHASGRLYVAFQTGGFRDWLPETGEERLHPWCLGRYDGYSQVSGLAVDADGQLIVLNLVRGSHRRLRSEDVGYALGADGVTAEVWARPNQRLWNTSYSFALRPGTDELLGIGTHAGGTQFVRVRARAGALVGTVSLPPGGVSSWALAPDGERVAWISDRGLYVCGLEPSVEPLTLPAADGEHRRGLAWSPDGRLISYTTGTTVRLLDSGTLGEVRALDWNIGKPRAVAFNPDGLRAAVSGDGGRGWVTVFDLE